MKLKLTPAELRLIIGSGPTLQEVHELHCSTVGGTVQMLVNGVALGDVHRIYDGENRVDIPDLNAGGHRYEVRVIL